VDFIASISTLMAGSGDAVRSPRDLLAEATSDHRDGERQKFACDSTANHGGTLISRYEILKFFVQIDDIQGTK
jgi:hypothetical protein